MRRLVFARPAVNSDEMVRVRELAAATHAPADWGLRARIVMLSWAGSKVSEIAEQVGCHPRTVRQRLHRFNTDGVQGLSDRRGCGRPRRISEQERSHIIALAKTMPPYGVRSGLVQADEASTVRVWTLDALTDAANAMGITVSRSQLRRILLADGARWGRIVTEGKPSSTWTPARQRAPR